MLDESICHFRGVGSTCFCRLYIILNGKKILLANNVDPDQMPQDVASDLGLPQHCLPVTLLRVSRKEWVNAL